jgi:hypothetical protein
VCRMPQPVINWAYVMDSTSNSKGECKEGIITPFTCIMAYKDWELTDFI